MHALTVWFTRNPVAANLLTILALVAAVFTIQTMRIEGFPALPPSSVTVTTIYPGAAVEQVDRGLTRKMVKALEGMPGLKKTASFSEEGVATVWARKESGFDMDRFQNEIRTRIDAIATLPQGAERPIVSRDEFNVEALLVQVYGQVDTDTLQKVARQVRDELQAHPKITKMTTFGLRAYEVRIEVDDDKLRSHGLSLTDVTQAIHNASLDYRTGSIESEAGKVTVRADQKALHYADFAAIPVRNAADGSSVTIADLAAIIDGFTTEPVYSRFQGDPAVGMQVFTSKKGHLIEVSEAAHEVMARLRPQMPEGVQIDIWGEYSIYMKDRLSLLATNAWQGLLIVFVLLALFLEVRLAFWVAMGIPISIAGALVVMGDRVLGYSLNDITTFGMIIVLGILVDDAIVVGESVFEERGTNPDPEAGTIAGVHRVSTATVFGCFTTISAFAPLLLIDSDIGKIFASFSVVVIVSLLASLVESKLILPAHLAAVRFDRRPTFILARWWGRLQKLAARGLQAINRRLYQPLLGKALRHRYSALLLFLTLAVAGLGAMGRGWVRTVFFPEVPGQIISVSLKMEGSSPLHLTTAHIETIEKAAEALNREVLDAGKSERPPIARIMTALTGPFDAEIFAELQPEAHRQLGTMETLNRWRERVGRLEGVEELTFSGSFETGGGFVVELEAREEQILKQAVSEFCKRLETRGGVNDVRHDLDSGSPNIRLRLKPEARHLGLTTADLAAQIGDAFGGYEVQRIQRGAEEVKIMVQFGEQRRRNMRDILDTRVRTATGEWVPLPLVASLETGYVPSSINRQNGRRVVQVRAALDKSRISAGEAFAWIQAEVAPELVRAYPDLSIRGAGELEEMGEMRGGLKRALVFILILIYVLLAIPLKSYVKPLVIMAVIPFGFIGAVIGHWFHGAPLSVLSFFGMLAVTGVVVNDSLVLLTRFREIRERGVPLRQALIEAGRSRFRAIFLTTVTTSCGLLPLLSETSEQAQYLIPAAISLAWGEIFATPITLMIVPILVHVGHDVGSWFRTSEEEPAVEASPEEATLAT
ncbi:Efflux RND transporter permease subunit [Sulfidibacter corallicola]|uniref:Efflux RND transporter permease subunit n=1 Tax=Sulfidibacter corallicola TaxID=2818388 RepID=A0A8A4TNI5_SULCO|nr:efflux RND transporter permease subunit [Sulfidibacter corallicola]QTD50662.1 efflux RND transporter permease subunit [Sulfidibacter corallicola]